MPLIFEPVRRHCHVCKTWMVKAPSEILLCPKCDLPGHYQGIGRRV